MRTTAIICYFFVWISICGRVICQLHVHRLSISPQHPLVNGTVALRCEAFGFDPSSHEFIWQRSVESVLVNVAADDRTYFTLVQQIPRLITAYSQSVIIDPLRESDQGLYLCAVIDSKSGNHVAQEQGNLSISYPEEFPVCSPDGTAEVTEGDSLYCMTVIDTRTPQVETGHNPRRLVLNWTITSIDDPKSDSGLRHNVTTGDDGLTYNCSSISSKSRETLSCRIGPLTVITSANGRQTSSGLPGTTCPCPETELSVASLVFITAAVAVVIASIVIDILFCQYKPRRWKQLLGMCTRKGALGENNTPTSAQQCEPDGKQRVYESTIMGPASSIDTQTRANNLGKRQPGTNTNTSLEPETSLKSENVKSLQSPQQDPTVGSNSTRKSSNQSTSTVAPQKLHHEQTESSGQRGGPLVSVKPAGAYMDLNLSEEKTDIYTELKR